jgi:hypothetical protein
LLSLPVECQGFVGLSSTLNEVLLQVKKTGNKNPERGNMMSNCKEVKRLV